MTRPPADPKRRREAFAPCILYLAQCYAAANTELRALFEACGYDAIELAYAEWQKQRRRREYDELLVERATQSMLRALRACPEFLEADPALLQRFLRTSFARHQALLRSTIRDAARLQQLQLHCEAEITAAFFAWDGETAFELLRPDGFETLAARTVRAALPMGEALQDHPELAGPIIAVTNDWMEALAERITSIAGVPIRLVMVGQDKVIRRFHAWSVERPFRPWARTVARNAMIDVLREGNADALNQQHSQSESESVVDSGRNRLALLHGLDRVLTELNAVFESLHADGTLTGNRVEACRSALEAWRNDQDKDSTRPLSRKDKQRARESVEAALLRVYAVSDCAGVGEVVIDMLRRLFGSLESTRTITPRDIERLEKAGLLLKQQLRDGRYQVPEWALTLIVALLELNAITSEDV